MRRKKQVDYSKMCETKGNKTDIENLIPDDLL